MENTHGKDIYNPVKVSYRTSETTAFRDQLDDRLDGISEKIELFLYAVKTPDNIKSLCDRFKLAPTQVMFLTCIIRDVAVALMYYGDMAKETQTRLDVPEPTARGIAQAVTELYSFALDDIKKMQLEYFKDRIVAAGSAAKPPEPNQTGNILNLKKQP